MKSMTTLRMRLTESSISTTFSIKRTVRIALILTSMVLESRQWEMPWDKWFWSIPQATASRRHNTNLPVKAPSFECECPPYKECVIDYKVNKDMVDFLHMRGIIKKKDLQKVREDLENLTLSSGVYQGSLAKGREIRNRRSNDNYEDKCCCPPKNMYMPTFITDHKFDKLVKRYKQDEDNDKN